MKRKHEMPFGAECRDDGTVCFRLWAPRASSIHLHLADFNRELVMLRADGGWFELATAAQAGTQYQFRIEGSSALVPDPASRFQRQGVHGASEVIDPFSFEWSDDTWHGRDWDEAVIYELHVGTFSAEGTFAGAGAKLDYLAELGVTAIELMPIASFPGERNWGYDDVLQYAPARSYGDPNELKQLIDSAHARNLMVFLDVVYNHFGPEGNYLESYAPECFTHRHQTPWGKAINFDGPCSQTVRDFFIHNALYWLEEYHFDGLRFDAVHAIKDDSRPDILTELAETVRSKFGDERRVHLILENDNNAAHYLSRDTAGRPRWYTAQWNDDIHHALHVLVSGERDGYYAEYAQNPLEHLGKCLTQGFSFQGESSVFREGADRGEPSNQLPLDCFVSFLQNHDQIGNRALGERINAIADPEVLRVAVAVLLLAPSPPLLFMGEEFAAATPFQFFCDFGPELAAKVTEGRRAEFARFREFSSPEAQSKIPDPNSEATFVRSKLDWKSLEREPHKRWLEFYRHVLTLRGEKIAPIIQELAPGRASFQIMASAAIDVRWPFLKGGHLRLIVNFGQAPVALANRPEGEALFTTKISRHAEWNEIAPLSAAWFLNA